MLISCNRLKSYIKNSEDINFVKVWDTFTVKTAEVEKVTEKGKDLKDVITAKIVSVKKHPESKKLSLLKVSDGTNTYDIVCGAPNVKEGLIGVLVKENGMVSGIKITKRKLAGYISEGMMCAFDELGIGTDHEGIIELPDDTPIGVDIKTLYPIEDVIVEIDNKSLTNRPDLWGHYGIAREIAAITGHELLPLELLEVENNQTNLDIKILNEDLCPRYCGIKVKNLTNNKTPISMQIFLNYVGMRSISLFVDLTNYLMLELGQPMHAFDERVVKNITVKLAKENDTYTTLDKQERKLYNDTLMITNGSKYFGIAGVMGGLDSEILPDTNSIFIESANFNAGCVRKTAVKLGLRTEASSRYEKSLDPNLCDLAIKRLLYLLKKENPDMQIASNLTDIYPHILKPINITLTKQTIKRYTNIPFTDEMVKNILESLDFKVQVNKEDYLVTVPTVRATKDVTIPADLIEELVRIYGYDKIKEEPLKLASKAKVHETIWDEEYLAKKYLATAFKMNEIHSYLWFEDEALNKLGIIKENVKLIGAGKNKTLRDDLPLSLLPIVKENLKNYEKIAIFEIGTVIKNDQNNRHLAVMLAKSEKMEDLLLQAKEITASLFKSLKHQKVTFKTGKMADYYHDKSQQIWCNEVLIGYILMFNSQANNYIGKKKSLVAIDIDFDKFREIPKITPEFKAISKYPTVTLDYTITTPKEIKYADLEKILDEFKSNLILKRTYKDVFLNKDSKNYTIAYEIGSYEKTLAKKELENFQVRFINHIKNNGLEIIS